MQKTTKLQTAVALESYSLVKEKIIGIKNEKIDEAKTYKK